MKLDHILLLYKINSKQIKDLTVKTESYIRIEKTCNTSFDISFNFSQL